MQKASSKQKTGENSSVFLYRLYLGKGEETDSIEDSKRGEMI